MKIWNILLSLAIKVKIMDKSSKLLSNGRITIFTPLFIFCIFRSIRFKKITPPILLDSLFENKTPQKRQLKTNIQLT